MQNNLPENFNLYRYGLYVRLVCEEDAEFIMNLRTNEKLGRYINPTSCSVENQKKWIQEYKLRESSGLDYYFMFEYPKGNRLGVCRIYDINSDNFTIGSWIFSPDAPKGAAILGDIITREIAYSLFPLSILYFDVKKANINVNRYHAAYKSKLIREDESTNYYCSSKEDFEKYKEKFIRMFNPINKK